jgi:ABC-type bacteriocin/lantibiotic exporter with double-glycine peptidase domain
MNKNLKLILFTFTRQTGMDGCGAACLATIMKYSGLNADIPIELKHHSLSLLQLQQISERKGLRSRAVRMNIETLRKSGFPSILHVVNEEQTPHFIIYYAYEPKLDLHLIGDPDGQVCYISEPELIRKWQSKAGLIFEPTSSGKNWRIRFYPWINLFHFNFVPGVLWLAIPFLNTFATLLGFGATLVIEKAVSPQFLNGELNLMVLIFILLLSLSAAKCGINFIKQRLIINFAGKLDTLLYVDIISSLEQSLFNTRLLTRKFSEAIKDVQRIHQSASMLIGGIFCDGFMMLIMFICLYFYFPVLIFPEAGVVCILLWLTDYRLPFMLINYKSTQAVERLISHDGAENNLSERTHLMNSGIMANSVFSRKSQRLSAMANRLNFYFEAITSGNLLLILAYAISQLRMSSASYQEFLFGLILCYGIVATATKICNQLFLVANGVEILSRHKITG